MRTTAECVVVGGGVVGLSIAYHVAARGMTDVVVLERERMVGTGSTGRCAGGFRHQFSNEANVRLSLLSIDKLKRFAVEMDQPLDLHQDGYLFLLCEPAQVATFEAQVELQRRLGVAARMLRPEEIAAVLPGTELGIDDVLAASYCPDDGVSDPAGVTEGYRRNATRLGVRIETGCEVTGVDVARGRVTGVDTSDGRRIAAPCVVNAAGPHAAAVGRMAGVDVPVEPARRFIWTTHPFAGAPLRFTLVIDFSTGFYFHRESGGVLFGMGNRAEPPSFSLDVDEEFFESVVIEVGMRRLPALADAGIRAAWAGSYEMSPDANPILGRVAGVDGFVLANGFSGHGFQHAPGVGQLIAELITDGAATSADLSPFSIDRFDGRALRAELGVV
ncbi:MAG TPA: FAD-binding oxidoreductase [Candidatus Polarisedimenticolaceae bacterium]|nr:FAD-binding oxidoreductase [Candidatus Polarisedimenticolaceae bacterium]